MFVIGLALLFVPFLYNPNALQLATLRRDYSLWALWAAADGGTDGRATSASNPNPNPNRITLALALALTLTRRRRLGLVGRLVGAWY
jgi:hypothetical protein